MGVWPGRLEFGDLWKLELLNVALRLRWDLQFRQVSCWPAFNCCSRRARNQPDLFEQKELPHILFVSIFQEWMPRYLVYPLMG